MSQEVRGYIEAVLNSLAANVPKVHIVLSISLNGLLFVSISHWSSVLVRLFCFDKWRKQRKTCLTRYTTR
jgi:hypothetical protein